MTRIALIICTFAVFLFAAPIQAQEAAPETGVAMRIRQDIKLGDLSATNDYLGKFFTASRFRVQGTMNFSAMEMTMNFTIVGDGKKVRQVSEMPFGKNFDTIDLERIRKVIPEYDPSTTYDPRVYQKMIADENTKPIADLELEGMKLKGYEVVTGARVESPANVPLGLPNPSKMRFWINPDDGIARKVELEDDKGVVFLSSVFSDVKTGVAFNAADFELVAPKEVVERDITDMVLGFVAASREKPKAETQPATGEGTKQ